MKKILILTYILSMSIVSNAVGIYFPKSTANNLRLDPLNESESAYIVNTNEYSATMYIGNNTKVPYKIVDNSALRSYKDNILLPVEEVGICPDSNTYLDVDDKYVCTVAQPVVYYTNTTGKVTTNETGGIVGHLTIRVPSKYVISNVSFGREYPSSIGEGIRTFQIDRIIHDNECIIKFAETISSCPADYIKIFNIKVYVREFGEIALVNNTIDRHFKIKDTEGVYELKDLRNELYHKYDGNRGKDWANYVAKNDIFVEENRLVFDKKQVSNIQFSQDKLNFNIYNTSIMQMQSNSQTNDVYSGTLEITAVNHCSEPKTFQLTYLQTIKKNGVPEFDASKLQLLYTDSFSSTVIGNTSVNWRYLKYGTDYTVTDLGDGTGIIDCPYNIDNKSGFYRLKYGELISDSMRIDFNADVHINKGLYVVGDDGVTYRISINAGTITAIPQ